MANKKDGIEIQGKGGYRQNISLPAEVKNKIIEYIKKDGSFKISRTVYEKELKKAFTENNTKYAGTHSLCYTFAQHSFIEKVEKGVDGKSAQLQISESLGHHRPDITLTYLK